MVLFTERKGGNFAEGTCPRNFGTTNWEAPGGDFSWVEVS